MDSDSRIVFAHTLKDKPSSTWEPLEVHASEVARYARSFAAAFGAGDWGELLGLWHDLGKLQPDFQAYISGENPSGPPHAWVGAVLAAKLSKPGIPLAFAIAGHHTGLADLRTDATVQAVNDPTPLMEMIQSYSQAYRLVEPLIPPAEIRRTAPVIPKYIVGTNAMLLEMFTRFLFSALVDADRLATARFYARFQGNLTAADFAYDDLATLCRRLDQYIDALPPKGSPTVAEMRRQVLVACRKRSADVRGRFSLTVPTGGGKTLSALSFALNHAVAHGLKRVIVVIPYTSIIEQSAHIYKEILGASNVLEHHSNLDVQKLTELDSRGEQLRKLAADNWDAPVVVTTTGQFFESLLSNHPGRCRKLHNIAQSVVVLDEVQTLPPEFLRTIVDVLSQLGDHYGTSVVLATATPPALIAREASAEFPARIGLHGVLEIMPDPSGLAKQVRRVRVEWRTDARTPYDQLAKELQSLGQTLAIVHRRDDARRLAELIGGGALHLSAAMCPAHRLEVIAEVRRRLNAGEPCILVSTQLIEAGVDLDFPVVYRALAGLDSIAQSAGRCDREGRLTDAAGAPAGRLIVFRAETAPPPGTPRKALDSMSVLLKRGGVDPFEPADSVKFFDNFYSKIDQDHHRIEPLRKSLMFASVAAKFRLIDNDTQPVVVPWRDGLARLEAFRAHPSRETQRGLQPFIVEVRTYILNQLRDKGITEPVGRWGNLDAVCEGRESRYDDRFGLDERDTAPGDAVAMIFSH